MCLPYFERHLIKLDVVKSCERHKRVPEITVRPLAQLRLQTILERLIRGYAAERVVVRILNPRQHKATVSKLALRRLFHQEADILVGRVATFGAGNARIDSASSKMRMSPA